MKVASPDYDRDTTRFDSEVAKIAEDLEDLAECPEGRACEPLAIMGRGHFAKVHKARHLDTNECIAMKCFKKDAMKNMKF